ncbi:MAG TPA: hypothetical protein VFC35_10365 [Gemmatimonadaceae bacterium]|nr:hypothetical protein [Gemmatimonadaceae bacterium]
MTKPVILAVDDDPGVLSAIERDLRQHYRAHYRIMKAASAANALDAVEQGGHVAVTAEREMNSVVVRITDDGPGHRAPTASAT